ncbi:MAG: hypothetical protein A2V66_12730 [Ignavibacteria bacterium RBG_13_36_8]|nr:MAG: hypothetical protein A2V66_12730 [Ignavibacteria bacterium RBG_13_36_8]
MFVFFSQVIRLFTNFLIFVGIARLYGPESVGQFSLAYTVAGICLVFADFGFDVLLTTEVAKNRKNAVNIVRRYFSMKIIFVGISSLIMIAIPSLQNFSQNSRILIYTLTLYVVFTSFANFFYAIFRGFEKFEYETKISFATNLILLILMVVFGFFKTPLVFLIMLFVFARLIGVVLCIVKVTSLIGEKILKIDFSEWKYLIRQVLIFGIHFLFGNLYFQLDTILLGLWKGDEAVGIYQSAFKIMLLLLLIPDIAVNTLLPVLSRLYVENIEKWKVLSRLLSKVLMLIVLPISIVIYFYSEQLISVAYGKENFSAAIPILQIFSIIILIRFIVEPYALMITTSKRQYIRMIIVLFATAASYGLNLFIIPRYGIYGAALVSLGVNIFVGLGYIFVNNFNFFKWTFELRNIVVFLSVILMIALVKYFHAELFVLGILILLYTVLVYFVGLTSEDRKVIFADFIIQRT